MRALLIMRVIIGVLGRTEVAVPQVFLQVFRIAQRRVKGGRGVSQPVRRRTAQTFHLMVRAAFAAHLLYSFIKNSLEEGADLSVRQTCATLERFDQRRTFPGMR